MECLDNKVFIVFIGSTGVQSLSSLSNLFAELILSE